VELVCARLEREADVGPGTVAVFRVDGILLDIDFLHHVWGGHVAGFVADADCRTVYL
jgi:hypothetical protein